MKISYIITLILIFTFILAGCGAAEPEQTSSDSFSSDSSSMESISSDENESGSSSGDELKTFTLEELAEFDGKEGRKAYVAVNGLVYDVSEVSAWSGGSHFSNITAGKDLTEIIENDSPHGLRVLDNLPIVGKLDN